jgi:hypothetical protein
MKIKITIAIASTVKPKTLKITDEDYAALATSVIKAAKTQPSYASYKDKNLSDMRYNWDMFRASKFDINRLYNYLNDSHINAALASILKNSGASSKK